MRPELADGHIRSEPDVLEPFEGRERERRVFGFADLTAGQVMIPRTEMVAVPITATLEQVCEEVQRLPYPWLPVYRDRLDDIAGIAVVTDLCRKYEGDLAFYGVGDDQAQLQRVVVEIEARGSV